MEHIGVDEPLGLLDQQTGCCDKLSFGKQRLELAHGTHRSAASRPIAPQPEPVVSPMRYQRAPHPRRIGAVASIKAMRGGLLNLLDSRITTPRGRRPQPKSSACLCPPAENYALPMFDPGRTFLAAAMC